MSDDEAPARALPTLDLLLEGCQIIGPDWAYLYVNDALLAHARRSREELLGRSMMEVYPGIERTPMFGRLRACMESGAPQRLKNEFTYPDGSTGWFELRMQRVPEGVLVLSLDVSSQEAAAARIRHLNAVLRGIRNVNQLITRERDPDALIQEACRTLVDTRGFRVCLAAVRYDGRFSVFSAGEDSSHLAEIARMVDRGEPPNCITQTMASKQVEVRQPPLGACEGCPAVSDYYRSKDIIFVPILGEDRVFGALSVVVPRDQGSDEEELDLLREVAGDLGFALTGIEREREHAKLETQFRQAQKMEAVGRLAGGIAHDFNNHLSVVLGCVELAMGQVLAGDPLRGDLDEIQRAATSAAALTRQLLAFSRQQVLSPDVIDLNQVVGGVQSMLARLLGEDVNLVLRLDAELGAIAADRHQIEQVLMNLAVNARDAMPHGGRLTISTSNVELDDVFAEQHATVKPGPHVMLAISDDGVGMPSEVLEHVFEPFFTTKQAGVGTGLGLSMVYGIVKQSGGSIWAYSEPGLGSTFRLYFPRELEGRPSQRAARASDLRGGTETILVVEDQPAVRKVIERVLGAAGYRVLSAAQGAEALAICKAEPAGVQLLLTDLVLPEMPGTEVARRMREILPDLRILYMSGYSDPLAVRDGLLDPATNFVGKPFSADELRARVRTLLDA